MIETNHYWQFNSFENISVITTIALPVIFYRDGELVMGCTSEGDRQYAEYMSKLFSEKLVNPDWQAYFFGQAFSAHTYNSETFYQGISPTYKDTNKQTTDPNCDWQPVQKPLQTEDQVVHAGTVRSRTATGNICVAAKNHDVELCLKWCDFRFAPNGWELFAYGPEGLVVEKDANGVRHNTEWALSKPDGMELSALMSLYTASRLVEALMCVEDSQYLNEDGHFAMEAIEFWTNFDKEHYDRAGALPLGVRLSTEQSEEVGKYRADLITYVAEQFAGFVDGSNPMSNWDNYQKTLDQMGRQEVLAIYQEAIDDYNAKQG
jgi:putative aldouronate transport system substrate-binding protein